jgi:hypothetical protein
VYDVVTDFMENSGVALLAEFIPPPNSPAVFKVQTLGGINSRGSPSGLKGVWGNCFGQGSWYCAPVFAVDPNDFHHLYAADPQQEFVAVSRDAGESWTEDGGLTNSVTAGGLPMTDSIAGSQVHVFAFDPGNSSHVLVGTDQAGIFASANGGLTWSALPNTAKGTYGRGLWKLSLDWSTVQ